MKLFMKSPLNEYLLICLMINQLNHGVGDVLKIIHSKRAKQILPKLHTHWEIKRLSFC